MYNLIYLFYLSWWGLLTNFLCIIAAFWGLWAFFFFFFNWNLGSRLRFDVVFMGYDLWIGLVLEFEIPIYYWLCILYVAGWILFCLYTVAWLFTTTFSFFFCDEKLGFNVPFKGYILVWFYNLRFQCTIDYAYYYLTNIFPTFCFTNQ